MNKQNDRNFKYNELRNLLYNQKNLTQDDIENNQFFIDLLESYYINGIDLNTVLLRGITKLFNELKQSKIVIENLHQSNKELADEKYQLRTIVATNSDNTKLGKDIKNQLKNNIGFLSIPVLDCDDIIEIDEKEPSLVIDASDDFINYLNKNIPNEMGKTIIPLNKESNTYASDIVKQQMFGNNEFNDKPETHNIYNYLDNLLIKYFKPSIVLKIISEFKSQENEDLTEIAKELDESFVDGDGKPFQIKNENGNLEDININDAEWVLEGSFLSAEGIKLVIDECLDKKYFDSQNYIKLMSAIHSVLEDEGYNIIID